MIRRAFGVPGFGRLFLGLTASIFGDSVMLIVLSVWVKTLTGSNAAAGLTFLWMTVPALAGPLLGLLVDRVPRRPFLLVANLASALVVLPLLLVRDASDVWIVYAVAFGYGVSFVMVPAALNGLLKDLLAEDLLVDVNASLSITREGFRLVGPLLGAGLFSVAGGGAVAVVDAVTFVVAALAVASLRGPAPQAARRDRSVRWWDEVAAGARFVHRTPVLLHTTVSLGLCLLVLGFSESAIYAVLDELGRPPTFVGPVDAVQGVGAVAGGLVSARLVRRYGEPLGIVAGLVAIALGAGGVAAGTRLWEVLVAVAVFGAGIPVVLVAFTTLLQRRTPSPLMGRVSTFVDLLTTTPQALSIALGALLVTWWDVHLVFATMAIGTLLAAAYPLVALRGRLAVPHPQPVAEHSDSPGARPARR